MKMTTPYKRLVYSTNFEPIDAPFFRWDSEADLPISEYYDVKCGGESIRVLRTDYFHYAPVVVEKDFAGFDVEITVNSPFEEVVVRPSRLGIVPEVEGNVVRFHIDKKEKLSIEFDGNLQTPLFLLCSERVEKPADANIVFEKGKIYNIEDIELKTGDCVYVEEGAILLGSFHAEHADDLKIVGNGIINGSCWHPADRNSRGNMIRIRYCKNLLLKGITVVDGPNWHVVPNFCENVVIDDINVMSTVVAGDGIDVSGSHDVVVKNCFIRASDDCLCIKSGRIFNAEDGYDGIVYNVHMYGNVCFNADPGNGIEIGYEALGDVHDVVFEDCDVIHSQYEGNMGGAALSIHQANSGHIYNITFRNIRVEQVEQKLFDLKTLDCKYSLEKGKGMIEDIYFEDITYLNGDAPMSIIRGFQGSPEHRGEPERETRLRNIHFKNINILGKHCENLSDMRMLVELAHGIYIEGKEFCQQQMF